MLIKDYITVYRFSTLIDKLGNFETNKKNLKEIFFYLKKSPKFTWMHDEQCKSPKKVYIARGAQESAGESKMINKYLMR